MPILANNLRSTAGTNQPVLCYAVLEKRKVVVIQYLLVSNKTLGEGGVQGQDEGQINFNHYLKTA